MGSLSYAHRSRSHFRAVFGPSRFTMRRMREIAQIQPTHFRDFPFAKSRMSAVYTMTARFVPLRIGNWNCCKKTLSLGQGWGGASPVARQIGEGPARAVRLRTIPAGCASVTALYYHRTIPAVASGVGRQDASGIEIPRGGIPACRLSKVSAQAWSISRRGPAYSARL